MAAAGAQGDVRLLSDDGRPAPPAPIAFPGLYRAADAAALSLQRQHFMSEAAQLALNPLAAGLVLLTAAHVLPLPNAVLTAIFTTLIVILLWVARASRFEKLWFECRDAAEEAKAFAWRYMMTVAPFDAGAGADDAVFVKTLDAVLRERPEIRSALGHEAPSLGSPITADMRRVRALAYPERLDLYQEARLEAELRWYAAKARRYARADRAWFVTVFVVQLAAVGYSMWLAVRIGANPGATLGAEGLLPVLTALGGAAMAWTRSKRFGDLSSSYTATAHALAGLGATRPALAEAPEQRAWVDSVETVLAREHEIWRMKT